MGWKVIRLKLCIFIDIVTKKNLIFRYYYDLSIFYFSLFFSFDRKLNSTSLRIIKVSNYTKEIRLELGN